MLYLHIFFFSHTVGLNIQTFEREKNKIVEKGKMSVRKLDKKKCNVQMFIYFFFHFSFSFSGFFFQK